MRITKEGTRTEKDIDAKTGNMQVAKLMAYGIRTTLGPSGRDKMLVSSEGDLTITNDGATILQEMAIEHPAARMIIEVAKTQDSKIGDGTTTAAILAGELLNQAIDLIEAKVHPNIITHGYTIASREALKYLEELSIDCTEKDMDKLRGIASTAMTGKSIEESKELLVELALKSILSVLKVENGKYVADVKKVKIDAWEGESVDSSEIFNGLFIDKERVHPNMPERVENAKIALLDCDIQLRELDWNADLSLDDPQMLEKFHDRESQSLKSMIDKVIYSGANVLFCQQGIDDRALAFLTSAEIFALRRLRRYDIDWIAEATGAQLLVSLDDLTEDALGSAGLVEEVKVHEFGMCFVREPKNKEIFSVLLRGMTEQMTEELKRSFNNVLKVLSATLEDRKVIPGGGAVETELSMRLKRFAKTLTGREQLVVERYANALEIIPKTLAENSGLDPIDNIIKLREAHSNSKGKNIGVYADSGEIADMVDMNVIESLRVKTQAIKSATDAANILLRIDDIVFSKPQDKTKAEDGKPAVPRSSMTAPLTKYK